MTYKTFIVTESTPEKLSASLDEFFASHPDVTMVSGYQSQSSGIDGISITFTLIYKEVIKQSHISGFNVGRE